MDFELHGANPERFVKGKVYDFSTNTNVIKSRFTLNKKVSSLYPSIEVDDLKALLPYPKDNILFTNGINEAIYIIASMLKSASIVQPTYVEYERALSGYGCEIEHINQINEISTDSEAVFICNPNNPDGLVRDLNPWIRYCQLNDILLIVDESYKDFTDYNEYPVVNNVIYLRSLTKIYQIAGLRLGYVVAPNKMINRINKIKPTWSVNSFAQQAGVKLLRNKKLITKTKSFYKKEVEWFKAEIEKLGFPILKNNMHYFLVKVADDERFIKYMINKRIVVRHTRNFRGLDGAYVRVATRTRKENKYFIKILKEYRDEY